MGYNMFRLALALLFTGVLLANTAYSQTSEADEQEQKTSVTNSKNKDFLGVFFIDTYPVTGCEVLKMRPSVIRSTTEFRAPEREEFNNNRNFSKVMHKYQGDLIDEAQGIAEKEGYNAIIGSKFLMNTHYQGAANLGTVDGNIGYGVGSITYIGHPVYIVCEDLAVEE